MENTEQTHNEDTQPNQGSIVSRFMSFSGKRKIRFGNTDVGVTSPRVKKMLSDSLMSKILVDKIMEAKIIQKNEQNRRT